MTLRLVVHHRVLYQIIEVDLLYLTLFISFTRWTSLLTHPVSAVVTTFFLIGQICFPVGLMGVSVEDQMPRGPQTGSWALGPGTSVPGASPAGSSTVNRVPVPHPLSQTCFSRLATSPRAQKRGRSLSVSCGISVLLPAARRAWRCPRKLRVIRCEAPLGGGVGAIW